MNPEEEAKMEQAAKALGMSVDEYKLGMNARAQLFADMDSMKVNGGNSDSVWVERDVHTVPKNMVVKITEAGKAKGKESVSKELVAALKASSEAAKTGRMALQKKMMQYIADKMKN